MVPGDRVLKGFQKCGFSFFWGGTGGAGVKSDKIGNAFLQKTRVGFSRTELSLRLS